MVQWRNQNFISWGEFWSVKGLDCRCGFFYGFYKFINLFKVVSTFASN